MTTKETPIPKTVTLTLPPPIMRKLYLASYDRIMSPAKLAELVLDRALDELPPVDSWGRPLPVEHELSVQLCNAPGCGSLPVISDDPGVVRTGSGALGHVVPPDVLDPEADA